MMLYKRRAWIVFTLCLALWMTICFPAAAMDWTVSDEIEDLPPDPRQQARILIRNMSLKEKVYQLFFVAPEALTGGDAYALENLAVMQAHPVGGVILFGQNIVSAEQLTALTASLRLGGEKYGGIPPFIAVDEEGGAVSRVANKLGYSLPASPETIGQSPDTAPSQAYAAGQAIAAYLAPLGINMDFAPVADVLVREVAELDGRSYGGDAALVAECSLAMAEGLRQGKIIPVFKHFPGHGAVTGNSHKRSVSSRRTLEEMRSCELLPFSRAIGQGAEAIMTSHLIARGLGDDKPASLSRTVIQSLLREQMGFDGLVITDALRMAGVTMEYKQTSAAVMTIQAGGDMILLPDDLDAAANAILEAVERGELSEDRIDESVARILGVKIQFGMIW